jgi:OmpA-OmpF porin, OOP family
MCQPKRWLWGLLPLALLWVLAGMFRTDPIQMDLTSKSAEQAIKTGFPWATASFDGRDATVTGTSPSPEALGLLNQAIDNVPGVRLVKNTATVLAEAKPFTWGATRAGAAVTLTGFIPDEAARARIIDEAKRQVPGATITDQMKLARGVPATFALSTAYGLAQLGRLPDGKAALTDAKLDVTGTAPTIDIYNVASAAGLPTGLTGSVVVGLPTIKPYIWQAAKTATGVTLTGLAPSVDLKGKIAAAAKTLAGTGSVTDQLQLANGAPAGFEAMTNAAFAQLTGLNTGTASLSDAAYSIVGAAPSVEIQTAKIAAARAVQPGFTLARADITAPTLNPYTWSATRNGLAITLAGYVPDDATRAANVAAARAAVPNALLTDQQTLGAGAPNGFAGMTAYGIGQLGQLNSGTASLSNTAYTIVGAAPSAAVRTTVVDALTKLGAGFTLASQNITAPAPPPPPAPVVVAPPAPVVVAPPPPPPAPVVVDTCQPRLNALLNEPILFDVNKDVIRSVSYVVLSKLADVAKSCPTKTIEIGAHTDSDASSAYNQDLSQRRAKAVVEHLVREGVAGTMLKSVGYGETKPIAPNDTPANKQKNRRVEFVVK